MSDYEDIVEKTSDEKAEEVVADENLTPEQLKALVEKLKSQITEIQDGATRFKSEAKVEEAQWAKEEKEVNDEIKKLRTTLNQKKAEVAKAEVKEDTEVENLNELSAGHARQLAELEGHIVAMKQLYEKFNTYNIATAVNRATAERGSLIRLIDDILESVESNDGDEHDWPAFRRQLAEFKTSLESTTEGNDVPQIPPSIENMFNTSPAPPGLAPSSSGAAGQSGRSRQQRRR